MRYQLRPLKQKDRDGMLEWMHDPTIHYLYTDKIRNATAESVQKFIADAEAQMRQKRTCHYAIVDGADEYLGTISLKNIEPVKGAEYAVSVRSRYQGKGIGSWATREILRIAFEELTLHRVYLNVLSDNEHANQFYVKNGFRYEGESRMCVLIGGEFKSLNWYAILDDEYRETEKRQKGY